jgi:hypothetical protein
LGTHRFAHPASAPFLEKSGAGSYFSWHSLVLVGAVLAPLAAAVLQRQDFTAVQGIFIIVACLAINQVAYVMTILLKRRNYLPRQGPNDIPHDGRDDDIDGKHKRHQNAQSDPR